MTHLHRIMFEFRMVSIFFIILMLEYNSVHADQHWLIEKSIESKLIYSLRDDVKPSINQCQRLLHSMFKQTFNTSWGHSMLDANAAIPSGILEDQYTSVGDYNECISIQEHSPDESSDAFSGQYCFLTFTQSNQTSLNDQITIWTSHTKIINRRFPYTFGICVPSVCSKQELTELFQNSKEFGKSAYQNIKVQYCQVDERKQSFIELLEERNTLIAFPILATICLLVAFATLLELFGNKINTWIIHFSAIKNTKTLFLRNENRPGTLQQKLSPIHGIRALAMLWILVGHNSAYVPSSISMPFSQIARHPYDFNRLINSSLFSNLFNNAYHAVETFLYLSGFLMVTVLLDKSKLLSRGITFVTFWGFRYLRFAVPLFGILVIHKCLFMSGNGPFNSYEYFNASYPGCEDRHWWKQLFFYNNLISPMESCIYFSWYLSADLQIHILAFLLVIALKKQLYRPFYSLCLFFGSFTIIIPAIIILDGMPTFDAFKFFADFSIEAPMQQQVYLYTAPYIHMGAFFFGAAMGLTFMNKNKLFFSTSKFWWIMALATMVFTALFPMPSADSLNGSHLLRGTIIFIVYGSWIVALNIIIYQMGGEVIPAHTEFLRKFLSASFWRPISRLSFSMYLSQSTVSHVNFVLTDNVFMVHQAQMVRYVFATTLQTILLGYILYILFECPVNNFMRFYIFGKKPQADKDQNEEELKNFNSRTENGFTPNNNPTNNIQMQ